MNESGPEMALPMMVRGMQGPDVTPRMFRGCYVRRLDMHGIFAIYYIYYNKWCSLGMN